MVKVSRKWTERYTKWYGLPGSRPEDISPRNIDHRYKRLKTLDGSEATIQRGGCNQGVYVVKHRLTGDICVQKKINGKAAYLRREIHLLHHIEHPNIIRFVDAYISKDQTPRVCSLYVEYCDLGGLDGIVERYNNCNKKNISSDPLWRTQPHRIPEDFVWHVLESVLSALQYMHHGLKPKDKSPIPWPSKIGGDYQITKRLARMWPSIIHRDIKLANIFLRSQRGRENSTKSRAAWFFGSGKSSKGSCGPWPVVQLADFGLSVSREDKDFETEVICGTPGWMPPEMPKHSALGDIWQTGAVIEGLCNLSLCGPLAYPSPLGWDGELWLASRERLQKVEESVLTEGFSDDLQQMVWRCLRFDKGERYFAYRMIRVVQEGRLRAKNTGHLKVTAFPCWACNLVCFD